MIADFEPREAYLFVRVAGEFNAQQARAMVLEMICAARREKKQSVLCDLTGVSGADSHLSLTMVRYQLATFVAKVLPRGLKVAFLQTRAQMEPDHFDENIMLNRGALVKITCDPQEALSWLGVAEPPSTTPV